MSLRMRHHMKVAPFIGAVLLSVDNVTFPLLVLMFTGLVLLFIPIRCPECSKRVDYNPTRVLLDQWAYTVCVPKRCSRCKYPLTFDKSQLKV